MAKNNEKKVLKKEEEIIIDEPIVEEEVVIEEPVKEQPTPVKMVKIKLKEEHKCHIGGEWYVFEAGRQYTVPEEVKYILSQNQLLLPI